MKTDQNRIRSIEWLTLLIGVAVAVIYYLQLKAAYSANNINAENFDKSQRAWLGPDLPSNPEQRIFSDVQAGRKIRWHLNLKNFGSSPALNSQWRFNLWLIDAATPGWSDLQRTIQSLPAAAGYQYTVFNGAIAPNEGESDGLLSLDQAASLNSPTPKLLAVLGGRLYYFDEFGSEHQTTLCVIYNPPTEAAPAGYLECPMSTVGN